MLGGDALASPQAFGTPVEPQTHRDLRLAQAGRIERESSAQCGAFGRPRWFIATASMNTIARQQRRPRT